MKKRIKFALFLIVALAFFLRFYKVWEVPPSLNWDETSIAYNAYSILKTGRDEWGELFPLHFRAFGEYKLPMQIYLSIPGILLFGLSEMGVRITPVVYGTITVLLTFFLAREIFRNNKTALLSAFLLAISPWHIQLTRASFESSLAVCFVVAGILFFFKGLKKGNLLPLSALFFGFSIYTYNAERFFIPVFVITLVFIFRDRLWAIRKKRGLIIAFLIFSLFILRLLPVVFGPEGQARFKLVSVVDDPGFVLEINEARGNLDLPSPIPRLVHNKLTHFIWKVGGNYLAHYTPSFLFFHGGGHKQHHVQGMGELYLTEMPFLLLGIWFLFRERKKRLQYFFVSWILLSAVPASMAFDCIPHVLRTLVALPSYQLLTAFGFVRFSEKIKGYWGKRAVKIMVVLIAFCLFVNFIYYLNLYYRKYSFSYSRDWQYGYKQVMEYVAGNQEKYDRVIITRHYGEPHIFTLFWLKYPPAKYQTVGNLVRFQSHDWVWVTQFDKYLFPDLGDPGTRVPDFQKRFLGKGKTLIVGKPGDFSTEDKILERIYFLNGQGAFEISEF